MKSEVASWGDPASLKKLPVMNASRSPKQGPRSPKQVPTSLNTSPDNDVLSASSRGLSLLDSHEFAFNTFNYRSIRKNTFDSLSNIAFNQLVDHVLVRFQASPYFPKFTSDIADENAMTFGVELRRRKCRIFVDDFVYIKLLGKGGFARVVHVMKRSTRQHFAMKIQSKAALLTFHGMNEGGLELEKTIIANNSNPFIVDMHYALQTENCAILVLGLVGGGDLSDLIQSSPHKKLPESLAAIYTYEISLALKHLHTNGVVYRDLKPSNILVDDFGH